MSSTHYTEKQCREALAQAFRETAPAGLKVTTGYAWMEAGGTPSLMQGGVIRTHYSMEVAVHVLSLRRLPKADYPLSVVEWQVMAAATSGITKLRFVVEGRAMQILLGG